MNNSTNKHLIQSASQTHINHNDQMLSSKFPFGITFGELRQKDIPEPEQIIHCLGRGDVALLNAITNVGKTTFLRNLMISLCTGKTFPPLTKSSEPRRVAFLDFEESRNVMFDSLRTMYFELNEDEKELFDQNSLLFCDERDEQGMELNLSDPDQFTKYQKRLLEFSPDLIIVDTLSSAFRMENENDNAEVKRSIMLPLKRLAIRCKAAIIATHHIGKAKAEEGRIQEESHRGRGASAFADHSWLVMNLSKDKMTNHIILGCAKSKGRPFEETTFQLDWQSRCFKLISSRKQESVYDRLLAQVPESATLEFKDMVTRMKPTSESTVKRFIGKAVKLGDLEKRAHGKYRKRPKVLSH